MISDEQVRRAVEYLRTANEYSADEESLSQAAPAELIDRVVEEVQSMPDVREDRVAHARHMVEEELPGGEELAAKLIGRVVSDSLR